MNTPGKNIRTLRQAQGWSQAEVAKRLKISIPGFSKIETGITDINLSRLNEIATLFEVHAVDILSADGSHPISISNEQMGHLAAELSEARVEIIRLQGKLIILFDENRALTNERKERSLAFDVPL